MDKSVVGLGKVFRCGAGLNSSKCFKTHFSTNLDLNYPMNAVNPSSKKGVRAYLTL